MKIHGNMILLISIILVQFAQECSADVMYPWGASESDILSCSSDPAGAYTPNNPFKLSSTRGLVYFGVTYMEFYISPNGFISDIAADGLSIGSLKRRRFPLNVSNSTWSNCNDTYAPNCWLSHYYDAAEITAIESAQNDSDICLHGTTNPDDHAYDFSAWQGSFNPSITYVTDPVGCLAALHPGVNYPNWMIAPYWLEMEITAEPTQLMFRETVDAMILSMAKADVERLSDVPSFNPSWAFVITWYSMTYSFGFSYANYPGNSFQVVIVTDGTNTYGIYNYNLTEMGGGTVGFDSGDGTNYCSLIYSRTAGMKALATTSNVGIPGRWVLSFSPNFNKTICEPLRTEAPSCYCDPGWEGRTCAKSIDDCASSPCPSNTVCVDQHMNYTCDYCLFLSCQNGGTCRYFQAVNIYKCICPPGFYGISCQINASGNKIQLLLNLLGSGNSTSGLNNSSTAANASSVETGGLSTAEIVGIATGTVTGAGLSGLMLLLCALKCLRKEKKEKEPLFKDVEAKKHKPKEMERELSDESIATIYTIS